jgi:molecular chaperone DnaK
MGIAQTFVWLSLMRLLVADAAVADEEGLVVRGAAPDTGRDGKTTEAIGLETLGGMFTPLLARQCVVPCSRTEIFTTAGADQTQITVKLYRGNADVVSRAILVGEFRIEGCVSGPRGVPQVALTVATRGRDLTLRAEELRSKKVCQIVQVRGR